MDKDELYKKMQTGEVTHLKYYLSLRGITVVDLAKLSGVNKRTLDDYVSGRRTFSDIGLGKGLRIAEVLKVDVYDLL